MLSVKERDFHTQKRVLEAFFLSDRCALDRLNEECQKICLDSSLGLQLVQMEGREKEEIATLISQKEEMSSLLSSMQKRDEVHRAEILALQGSKSGLERMIASMEVHTFSQLVKSVHVGHACDGCCTHGSLLMCIHQCALNVTV